MRRTLLYAAAAGILAYAAVMARSGDAPSRPVPTIPETPADAERIGGLLSEMASVELDALPALETPEFVVPGAGVDVMRVRLSETYTIAGVGRDTVELTGWIAVKHGTPRPAPGEHDVRWGTSVSDTEFVGLDLRGESPLFGPVHVTLDTQVPSTGKVGKLETPFLARVGLDLAYRDYRDPARPVVGGPSFKLPAAQVSRQPAAAERAIQEVLRNVMDAISRKDAEGMLKHYSTRADTVFFNTAPAVGRVTGGAAFVRSAARMFENIRTIKVIPNDDIKVRIADTLAVATLTGRNDVVDREGRRGIGSWQWTVQLEREGSNWVIAHDHLSFFNDPKVPVELRDAAGVCAANISVAVNLPKLDLRMRTKEPVQWYSEVTTIPPVGHTASVSLTPTPMVSGDRTVATLEHGAVTFREVVRHVPLDGTTGSSER